MSVNLEESPIDRLLREKREDAYEIHEDDILEFLSPDRNSSSKLVVDKYKKELYIRTRLYHSARMIDENIYLQSNILIGKFTEEQIQSIIEDISSRLRQIELPEILQKIPYNFVIAEEDENYTEFSYVLEYENIDSYDQLRSKTEAILVNSYELIFGYLMKMGLFIQVSLNQFLLQPEIEMKLLEIRSNLFHAKFYATMTGRFASDQRRIAQSMKKDALSLIAKFEKDYPDIASEKLQNIRTFFDI